MKLQQWSIVGVLLLLAAAAVASFILTGDYGSSSAKSAAPASAQAGLVDTSVFSTARALSPLATTPAEQPLVQEAARLADEEVDLAFADGLREARQHPSDQDPKYRELNSRIRDAQAVVDQDKAEIARLKTQLSSAKPAAQDSLQDQIALLEAQQAPDEDELDVAKQDLIRAGGDREGAIQRQRAAHEASREHEAQGLQTSTSSNSTPDLAPSNLVGQARAWAWLRKKRASLEAAQQQAQTMSSNLRSLQDALDKQVRADSDARLMAELNVANIREKGDQGASIKQDTAAALKSFQHFSTDQKLLAGYGKQLQDEQELDNLYGRWLAVVGQQQRSLLHVVLRSLLWIALIVLLVYAGSRITDRFFDEATPDRKRLFTLRSVIRFALQAVAVLLIALVVFGAPNQMPTVLGLAGAGLTVALKDFIVGFFGWFVLMGRNGIRVGDWVEINGVVGEVIEIGLLRTVLLETGNWTDTGHPTGRKVAFVNSFAIEGHYFNFSTAGQWLWDELQVTIPPGDNPYPLVESIQKLVLEETSANAAQAEKEWQKAAGQRMQSLSVAPAIQLRPTGSTVELQVRYITSANERYMMRARMYEKIVALLHAQAKSSA
jgi:small-conductance mechanosensitive channel